MIKIDIDGTNVVSGLLDVPAEATACFVVAHGAGAGMTHPFMNAVAEGLFARGIATLRFQFPFMEAGSRRPNRPALATASVRAAIETAARKAPTLALFAGGKSFGGRMTSQAQADVPLPGVLGLVFLGFPLHAANTPSDARADHLADVKIPMLFLQGTRDALADIDLMRATTTRLGTRATLTTIDQADHSFHVPVRSGRTDAQVQASLVESIDSWIGAVRTGTSSIA